MQLVLVLLCPVGEVLEEALVVFLGDFGLGSGPEGFDQVDGLAVDCDWEVDEVAVFLNDLLDVCFLGEPLVLFLQVQHDPSPSDQFRILRFLDFKRPMALTDPLVCLAVIFPTGDFDAICDNKGRVEPDTELPDDIFRGLAASFEVLDELFGA